MSGDYTRIRFDPRKHFTSVLMQQGRVQLDSDWNEMVDIFDRRLRAERLDSFGRAAVPRRTPDAFLCTYTPGNPGAMTIGAGRIYVDGLLAENHGTPANQTFDQALHEVRGQDAVDFATGQPYASLAAVGRPPNTGPLLAYLDVWQREVTFVEDPGLVEPALGVDTTTRQQTAWRVRVLTGPAVASQPAADAFDSPNTPPPAFWSELIAAPAGRLSTATDPPSDGPGDPCIIPDDGGYRSLDNRLYRVEVHTTGAVGTARFKWSRDNAAVTAQVTALGATLVPLDTITVTTIGRDSLQRFTAGKWVEIVDDDLDAVGASGELRMIASVDEDTRTIRLATALPANRFGADPAALAARRTRLRQWDQSGLVLDSAGNTLVDLRNPNSPGTIPLPAAASPERSVTLESGIRLTFTVAASPLTSPPPPFRAGDHWLFAARSATASIDGLDRAPPRGVHHHYAPLAWFAASGARVDLRRLWPAGDNTSGNLYVGAQQHADGTFTVQAAINQLLATGGTITLGPGVFAITGDTGLTILGARGLTIQGQGPRTVLARQFPTNLTVPAPPNPNPSPDVDAAPVADPSARALLRVTESFDVTVRDLAVLSSASASAGAPGLLVENTGGLLVERCYLVHAGRGAAASAAIGLRGAVVGATIRENAILAEIGVGVATTTAGSNNLLAADLRIEDNLLNCRHTAILLDGLCVFAQTVSLARNDITRCAVAGIAVAGITANAVVLPSLPASSHPELRRPSAATGLHTVQVVDNTITVDGTGLALRVSHVTVRGNRVRTRLQVGSNGSVRALEPPRSPGSPYQGPALQDGYGEPIGLQVLAAPHRLRHDAVVIDDNHFEHCTTAISFDPPWRSTAAYTTQQLRNLLVHVREVDIRRNRVVDMSNSGILVPLTGVNWTLDRLRIEGNTLLDICDRDIGPTELLRVGILAEGAHTCVVAGNHVERLARNASSPVNQTISLIAIHASRNGQLTVRDNHTIDIGPNAYWGPHPESTAYGFFLWSNLDDVAVSGNVVRWNRYLPDATTVRPLVLTGADSVDPTGPMLLGYQLGNGYTGQSIFGFIPDDITTFARRTYRGFIIRGNHLEAVHQRRTDIAYEANHINVNYGASAQICDNKFLLFTPVVAAFTQPSRFVISSGRRNLFTGNYLSQILLSPGPPITQNAAADVVLEAGYARNNVIDGVLSTAVIRSINGLPYTNGPSPDNFFNVV